jgi:hypothetical protein
VIEAPYLDLSGRRLFVACGPQGQRLGEGVAVNEADIERVSARLWRAVDIESRGEGSILEPPQLM